MTRGEKTRYNFENEGSYYFAPFTQQRQELRAIWGRTRKDWNSYLYDQEKKHQAKVKQQNTTT